MSAPFSVLPFHIRDLDRIAAVEQASFGSDAYDRKLFAEFADRCGPLFLVAKRNNRIWAYSITYIRGGSMRYCAELVSIAVLPAVRGQGAASSLLSATLRRLKRRQVRRFSLTVRVANFAARDLYQHYGFRVERRIPGYYDDGEDGLRMAKEIG